MSEVPLLYGRRRWNDRRSEFDRRLSYKGIWGRALGEVERAGVCDSDFKKIESPRRGLR